MNDYENRAIVEERAFHTKNQLPQMIAFFRKEMSLFDDIMDDLDANAEKWATEVSELSDIAYKESIKITLQSWAVRNMPYAMECMLEKFEDRVREIIKEEIAKV